MGLTTNAISIFFHWLYSPLGPWPLLFSLMIILQTVGLLGRVISSSHGLYLNTGQHKHRINTYTHQTSMSCVGFETTIPAFERAKTVHAPDLTATVTGCINTLMTERTMPNVNYDREKQPILGAGYTSEYPNMLVSVPSSYSGFFLITWGGGVSIWPLWTLTTKWPIVPAPDDR
jgi:hypothetical protein